MKKLSRLTALLLAIMVCCTMTAYAEGVSVNEFTMDDFLQLAEYGEETYGDLWRCDKMNCEALLELDTPMERYAYMMGTLYSTEDVALEALMWHLFIRHTLTYDRIICTCAGDALVYAPGSSHHEEGCAWANISVDAAEHKAAYDALPLEGKACYLLGMDAAQIDAMKALMTEGEQVQMTCLAQEGIPEHLRTTEIRTWMAENEVTAQMLELSMQASSLDSMMLVGSELIHVRTGEVFATYDAETNLFTDKVLGVAFGRLEDNRIVPLEQTAN